MFKEWQGNFWLYPILNVNNDVSNIHEFLHKKSFINFNYQTFCNRSVLVFYILAYNSPILFNDHGHNISAFVNFCVTCKIVP